MVKSKLWKIQVGTQGHLWKREHVHLAAYQHSPCVEKVIVYLEECKKSSLQLLFREEDNLISKLTTEEENWCVGYPDDGVIWSAKSGLDSQLQTTKVEVKLNRPTVIAKLIRYYIQNNWCPDENKRAMVVENAWSLLDRLDLPKAVNKERLSEQKQNCSKTQLGQTELN